MIRRYTLLGGAIALAFGLLYAFRQTIAPNAPDWALILGGVALGAFAGWTLSFRDVLDTRRLQRLVEGLTERRYGDRARIRRPGQIPDLARAIDALAERLSVSEEKKHRREDRLRTILDAMTEAVMVTDADGRVTLTNEVLTELVGFSAEGKTATEAIRHPDLRQAIEDAQLGLPKQLELSVDGAAPGRVLRASVSPLRNQQGVVTVFHDVTAERVADRVRRDFVANAGHELRTPLTAIRGFAETLREGAIEDPDSARGFIDVILRHTKRLQALVDDLADLSRFEGDELELRLEPVLAGALIDEVLRGLEAQSNAKGLTVTSVGLQEAPPVAAEERALEQVLVNLVDNAIKYTPEDGEVRIEVAPQNGEVVIEVANSGPGIAPRHLERVFERVYRVDAGRSRELGGTGLGLSIVKHLVAKIGGQITVDSGGGWTRFQLRVARADSPKSDTDVSRA
ncbi:MAG: PAS domain S-box protein [Myxococcales bacterium]|nr:MAG: PAS domain S-box protein [Myxococcales bacterium]